MEQIIYIKMDLALKNLQRLKCHKTQQTKPNHLTARERSSLSHNPANAWGCHIPSSHYPVGNRISWVYPLQKGKATTNQKD